MTVPRFKLICVLMLFMFASLAIPIPGRAASEPLAVRSVGLVDTDGTVLYSVLIASGTDALGKLTVRSTLPEDTSLVEVVAAPPGATVQNDGRSVTWQVEKLHADTILGPFTYRIKLADKTTEAPLNVLAKVSWAEPAAGSVEAQVEAGKLKPLAESGRITIDEKGTLNEKGENDLVLVGETGIWLYVPAGAISQKATLTLTRVPVDANSTPAGVADYWWCASVQISSEPAVQLNKPISISLPTRRTLTPGLPAKFFLRGEDGQWHVLGETKQSAVGLAKPNFQNANIASISMVTPTGNGVITKELDVVQITKNVQITSGVSVDDRKIGSVSGTSLPASQIQDGTSNTYINAYNYIHQDNIIAILIGAR